jgi:hypothetical protein
MRTLPHTRSVVTPVEPLHPFGGHGGHATVIFFPPQLLASLLFAPCSPVPCSPAQAAPYAYTVDDDSHARRSVAVARTLAPAPARQLQTSHQPSWSRGRREHVRSGGGRPPARGPQCVPPHGSNAAAHASRRGAWAQVRAAGARSHMPHLRAAANPHIPAMVRRSFSASSASLSNLP